MQDHEIKCPQPVRPLKRTGEHLDLVDHTPFKRQSFQRKPPEYLQRWLADLQTPFLRGQSKSDSFLIGRMVESNPLVPGKVLPLRHAAKVSNQDPQGRLALRTPVLSNTPVSAPSNRGLTPTTGTSKEAAEQADRVKKPNYRDEISHHKVLVDSFGTSIPPDVSSFAEGIVSKARLSPPLRGADLEATWKRLAGAVDKPEDVVRKRVDGTNLLPTGDQYGERIAEGGNLPFDRAGLPYLEEGGYPNRLVTPKTALTYGTATRADLGIFSVREYQVMMHRRIKPFAMPTTANSYPFFLVEFKASSRNGSHWAAENQNTGAGAHSVNSLETLLDYCDQTRLRKMTDTVAFSCVAFAEWATIWVHWREDTGEKRFVSSEIQMFSFKKPAQIAEFCASAKNIIEFGLGERLTNIKSALEELYSRLPDWDREDKAAKTRSSEMGESSNASKKPNSGKGGKK
jgi:hypothetical protein